MSKFLTASNIVGVDIGNLTTIAYSTLGDLMIEKGKISSSYFSK